jgi:ABC-type lipoprotein release transport system permease subunit
MLYGVALNDPYTISGVVVFVMITSATASYMPARRATRPDVIALLRDS